MCLLIRWSVLPFLACLSPFVLSTCFVRVTHNPVVTLCFLAFLLFGALFCGTFLNPPTSQLPHPPHKHPTFPSLFQQSTTKHVIHIHGIHLSCLVGLCNSRTLFLPHKADKQSLEPNLHSNQPIYTHTHTHGTESLICCVSCFVHLATCAKHSPALVLETLPSSHPNIGSVCSSQWLTTAFPTSSNILHHDQAIQANENTTTHSCITSGCSMISIFHSHNHRDATCFYQQSQQKKGLQGKQDQGRRRQHNNDNRSP